MKSFLYYLSLTTSLVVVSGESTLPSAALGGNMPKSKAAIGAAAKKPDSSSTKRPTSQSVGESAGAASENAAYANAQAKNLSDSVREYRAQPDSTSWDKVAKALVAVYSQNPGLFGGLFVIGSFFPSRTRRSRN